MYTHFYSKSARIFRLRFVSFDLFFFVSAEAEIVLSMLLVKSVKYGGTFAKYITIFDPFSLDY